MAGSQNLFGGNNQMGQMNFGNINVDISKLPDVICQNCKDSTKFIKIATLKMISPIQSPNGQWANAVIERLVCQACHHPFNMNEWLENQKKELNFPTTKQADG